MGKEKICNFCRKEIDLEIDKYVLLGTYQRNNVLEEGYYHFQCFNQWYNSKIIEKTKNTIQDASKKVAGMFGGLRNMVVKQTSGGGNFDFSKEMPNMEDEIPEIDLSMLSDPVKLKKKKDGKRRKRN